MNNNILQSRIYIVLFVLAAAQVLAPKKYTLYITILAIVIVVPYCVIRLIRKDKTNTNKYSGSLLDCTIQFLMLLVLIVLGYFISGYAV